MHSAASSFDSSDSLIPRKAILWRKVGPVDGSSKHLSGPDTFKPWYENVRKIGITSGENAVVGHWSFNYRSSPRPPYHLAHFYASIIPLAYGMRFLGTPLPPPSNLHIASDPITLNPWQTNTFHPSIIPILLTRCTRPFLKKVFFSIQCSFPLFSFFCIS